MQTVTKNLNYLRCPCCGKISRAQGYGLAASGRPHRLEVLVQSFVGRPRGFAWSRRPYTAAEIPILRTLALALRYGLTHVETLIAALSGVAPTRLPVKIVVREERSNAAQEAVQTVEEAVQEAVDAVNRFRVRVRPRAL